MNKDFIISCTIQTIIDNQIYSWLNNFPPGFIDFIIAITLYVQDLYSQKVTSNVRYFIIANNTSYVDVQQYITFHLHKGITDGNQGGTVIWYSYVTL